MQSSTKALTALFLGAFLSGCDPLLSTMVKEATLELGMPVTATTDDKDTCARSQMGSFLREYRKWPRASRDRFKVGLAEYQGIVIGPTEMTQVRTGDIIQIFHVTNDCPKQREEEPGKHCFEHVLGARTLTPPTRVEGPAPRTQVTRDKVLTIHAQAQDDRARFYDYETKEKWVFDSIYTPVHPKLGGALAPLKYSSLSPRVQCGREVSLWQAIGEAKGIP